MNLQRVDAYSILPQHGVKPAVQPVGGKVSLTTQLRNVIDQSIKSANFSSGTLVDFQVDTSKRTNDIRDLLLGYAFNKKRSAPGSLAMRLSTSMDKRSKPCLLISAVFEDRTRRAVFIWTFPQESALSFSTKPDLSIKLLTDVFSQTSNLRKAAKFEGRDNRSDFLSGHVIDLQATDPSKEVADFWVKEFLQCTFSLGPGTGSRMLARVVRKASDSFETLEEKEDLYSAVVSVRSTKRKILSIRKFAERFLPEAMHETFLKSAPDPEIASSLFKFQTADFDDVLQFRIFQLDTGVFVSSPLEQIGKSVKVTGDERRRLRCEGIIGEEKLRSRHA